MKNEIQKIKENIKNIETIFGKHYEPEVEKLKDEIIDFWNDLVEQIEKLEELNNENHQEEDSYPKNSNNWITSMKKEVISALKEKYSYENKEEDIMPASERLSGYGR